jgi:hypothetical protein
LQVSFTFQPGLEGGEVEEVVVHLLELGQVVFGVDGEAVLDEEEGR